MHFTRRHSLQKQLLHERLVRSRLVQQRSTRNNKHLPRKRIALRCLWQRSDFFLGRLARNARRKGFGTSSPGKSQGKLCADFNSRILRCRALSKPMLCWARRIRGQVLFRNRGLQWRRMHYANTTLPIRMLLGRCTIL